MPGEACATFGLVIHYKEEKMESTELAELLNEVKEIRKKLSRFVLIFEVLVVLSIVGSCAALFL